MACWTVELDDLSGSQLPQHVVAIVELHGAGHQPPAGAVRQPPLADAGTARRIQEVAAEAHLMEHVVQLVAGVSATAPGRVWAVAEAPGRRS